jgi:CelD/BcsL family acetyltransferase involved in cellulose biosynthesis
VRLETIHPRELSASDAALWRAHQLNDPALQSPYLTPDWAKLIGETRDDARVCVIQDGAGFFGAQRLSRFAAMGLGAPISDYQGVVGLPELPINRADLCRALRVGRIDITHAPAGQDLLKGAVAGREGSWIVDVAGGRDLYEAALKQRRSEFVRQTDKKRRKLEREHGDLVVRAQSTERADFETLLAWKNAQLKRAGQPAIWAAPWIAQTLNACFETKDTQFGGALFTLSIKGQLAAGAFCLRSARVLHFWVVAHDHAYESYSPGVQLARWIAGWAGDSGIAEIDFGPGDYQFKRQLSTGQRMLERGVVAGSSWSATVRRMEHAVREQFERLPQPRLAELPGKAMRRLDLMRALHA